MKASIKKVVRRARKTDPDTSHEAAALMTGTSDREEQIVRALKHLKHGTCYEIARTIGIMGITHVHVDRSMRVLERKGYAKETAERRPGDSGYNCIVWESV